MHKILLISLGSVLGANLRFALQTFIENHSKSNSDLSILLINCTGCLVLGLLSALLYKPDQPARYIWIIGFVGSFTAFSTFSALVSEHFQHGELTTALEYGILEPILGIGMYTLGMIAGKFLLH